MTRRAFLALSIGLPGLVVFVAALPLAWIGTVLREHWRPEAAVAGLVVVAVAVRVWHPWPAAQPRAAAPGGRPPPWPSDRMIAIATGMVMVLGVLTLFVLLLVAGGASGDKRPELRIEAIKYGLGGVAGAGAIAALLLAVRRQHLSEQVHDHTEQDAAERQVTEIYTKAVEQLGSPAAAVRLGGLHALERVAQNNVRQRQRVVDVICAYLGMPFDPPEPVLAAPSQSPAVGGGLSAAPPAPVTAAPADPAQELRVRRTAQQILLRHVGPDEDLLWENLDLDLTGAVLIDWTMRGARVRTARFTKAVFKGDADFTAVSVAGRAGFEGARFTGGAEFTDARFADEVAFERATFESWARFSDVLVQGCAGFRETIFGGTAEFHRIRLRDLAMFEGARFEERAALTGASFGGPAGFGAATFTRRASFDAAVFAGSADFAAATFGDETWFDGARFKSAMFTAVTFLAGVHFEKAEFNGAVAFVRAVFAGEAEFGSATFHGRVGFDGADCAGVCGFDGARVLLRPGRSDVWPPGWRLVQAPTDWEFGSVEPERPGAG